MSFIQTAAASQLLIGPNGQHFTNNSGIPKELAIFAIFNVSQYDGKPSTSTNLSVSDFLTPIRKLIYKIQNSAVNSTEPTDVAQIMKSAKGTAMHHVMEQALSWYGGYKQEIRSDKVINGVTISGKFDMIDTTTNTIKDLKHVGNYAYKKLLEDIQTMQTMSNSLTLAERFELIPSYTKYQFQLSAYHWLNSELDLNPYGDIIFALNDGGGIERYPVDNMHRFPLLPHEEVVDYITTHIAKLHTHLANGTLPDCTPAERGYSAPTFKLSRYYSTSSSTRTVPGSKCDNEAAFRAFVRKSGKPGDTEEIQPAKYALCNYCAYSSICDQPI